MCYNSMFFSMFVMLQVFFVVIHVLKVVIFYTRLSPVRS